MDNESLTSLMNLRVTSTVKQAIKENSCELGVGDSTFIRLCVYIGGPILMNHPDLKNYNRQQLEELASEISKTLVLQPASFQFCPAERKREVDEPWQK